MTAIATMKTGYTSDTLTQERRDELTAQLNEIDRTAFYRLSSEDVDELNEWTLENLSIEVKRLTFKDCVEDMGLVVVEPQLIYELDEDGEPVLDEKGKPVVKDTTFGEYRFACNVKVEGLVDANGKAIPKGQTKFDCTKQPTNRPLNETNYKHIQPRMPKWALNGETMIKDANGNGQSEQHRKTALLVNVLTGAHGFKPTSTIPVIEVRGIHPNLAITIDTGKPNSGKDTFGSDPEICPPSVLQSPQSLTGNTDGIKYVDDRSATRVKVCGETEAAAKLLILRLAGKNVNSSIPGGSNHATEEAHKLVSRILPELDDLAARVQVFLAEMPFRGRPCSVSELTAGLALWQLRSHETIDTIPRPKVDGGLPMDEVEPIGFDLDSVIPLLQELVNTIDGRFATWTKGKLGSAKKKEPKQVRFAMLLRAIRAFFEGDDITADLLNQSAIGGAQTASNYYHFGGADRGPIAKPEKESASE